MDIVTFGMKMKRLLKQNTTNMGNLLEDYYNAMNSGDEWRYVNAEEIRKKIEDEKEAASWNGREPNYDYSNEMGG